MADASQTECVFCKVVSGDITSYQVWEDNLHIAFLSIFPNTDGVTIVATKEHKPSYIFENDDKTAIELQLATKKVARLIDKAFENVGRCGIVYEGFGVNHLHSKIYPMHGTGGSKKWEQREIGEPIEFMEKYPGYITTRDSKQEDVQKLQDIAERIKRQNVK